PLHGPGRARLAEDRLLPPGQAGGGRADQRDLHQSPRQPHPGLHHRPLRLGTRDMNEHIVKSYEDELNALTADCARMGGLTEAQVADALDAVVRRDEALAESVVGRDERLDVLEAD